MFKHHPDPNIQQFVAWQKASDPRTQAPAFVQNIWQDADLGGIHPWQVSDCQQLRMYFAGAALVNDLAAEALGNTAQKDGRGRHFIEPTVGWYAVRLSDAAEELMSTAKEIEEDAYADGDTFDDATLADLTPNKSLPLWPLSANRAEIADWQFDEQGTPEVTVPFLRAIIGVARDLRAQTFGNVRMLYGEDDVDGGEFRVFASVPEQYRNLGRRLDTMQDSSEAQLAAAEHLLDATDQPTFDAYQKAHDGFAGMVTALVATYCPPALGREYVLQR